MLIAIAIVAADLVLSWKGQYMTPYRLGFLFVALMAYGTFARWDSGALGLTLRPVQGIRYWIIAALVIGGAMLVLMLVSMPILRIFGRGFTVPSRAPSDVFPWFYFACINAPILEELVYRFILCVPLTAVCGAWVAIVLSGVAFAGLHFVTGVASPDNVIGGFFLAWAFLKSGSIAVPMVLHALGNACILGMELGMWYWHG
jgi:membrane protease YdiL (CAAX protease family)